MKESLVHSDRRVVFRETFNSEYAVARNGGENTDVVISGGTGSFNGTSSKIDKPYTYCGTVHSIRFKGNIDGAILYSIVCGDYNNDYKHGLAIGNNSDNKLYYNPTDVATGSVNVSYVNDYEYHDYIVVRNGTSVKFYVDGVQIGSEQTLSSNVSFEFNSIGTDFDGTVIRYFSGEMDLVEIYDKALTDGEVEALYDNTLYSGQIDDELFKAVFRNNTIITDKPYTIQTEVDFKKQGMWVDGTGDYLYFGNIDDINNATALTFSMYVKKFSATNQIGFGSADSSTNGIWLNWFSNGDIYFNPKNGGVGGNYYNLSFTPEYYHIVGVYDGTQLVAADRLKIYVNGIEQSTVLTYTPPTQLSSTAGNDFQIGNLPIGTFPSKGIFKDVRIYNKALTEKEIAILYNSLK